MKTAVTPWSGVMLESALQCQRAACFALGCLEREHRLNLDALMAYWTSAAVVWWAPQLAPHLYPGARIAAATSSAPSPRAMP